jgi:hypothetical protein
MPYLHPRQSVVCPGEGVGPAYLQDCATVDFIAIGRTWDHQSDCVVRGRGKGLWSIEVSDHALGRALQRDPTADLGALLFEAHRAAQALRIGVPKDGFLIPAGRGSFRCSLRGGPDETTGKYCVWVSAHTWLHADQLADDQHFAPSSATERLGDSLLRPLALRHLDAAA